MPVYSSRQIIKKLEGRGFQQSKGTGKKGTHRTWYLRHEGAASQTVTIVLNQRETPQGTLRNYAKQLGIPLDALLEWLSD